MARRQLEGTQTLRPGLPGAPRECSLSPEGCADSARGPRRGARVFSLYQGGALCPVSQILERPPRTCVPCPMG